MRKRKVLFLLLVLVGLNAAFWPGTGNRWVEFDVAEGTTAHDLAIRLKDAGLLTTVYPFLFWVRARGAGSRVQIGRYKLSEGRSAFWIVDDFLHGRTQKVKVTVPEGFASWQIAERLEEAKICSGEEFKRVVVEQGLEGYLFPATYEFNYGTSPGRIAKTMKEHFDLHWPADFDARAQAWGWTRKEAVTLASILEREIRVREELPQVSALYHNRLKRHMRLQADPTVQYAQGVWVRRLTYDDYRNTDSPYNTYLHDGLPPGPICSPSMDALRAALWPADSDALYMVAAEDGHHNFSSSYREHTNKVNRRNRQKKGT